MIERFIDCQGVERSSAKIRLVKTTIIETAGITRYVLPKKSGNISFVEIIDIALGVAIQVPPYLEKETAYWLVAHLFDLKKYASKDLHFDIGKYLESEDPIFRSRTYYALEFIGACVSGGELGSYDTSTKMVKFKKNAELIGFMDEPCWEKNHLESFINELYDPRFKTWESAHFFARAPVFLTIPDLNAQIDGLDSLRMAKQCVGTYAELAAFNKSVIRSDSYKSIAYSSKKTPSNKIINGFDFEVFFNALLIIPIVGDDYKFLKTVVSINSMTYSKQRGDAALGPVPNHRVLHSHNNDSEANEIVERYKAKRDTELRELLREMNASQLRNNFHLMNFD